MLQNKCGTIKIKVAWIIWHDMEVFLCVYPSADQQFPVQVFPGGRPALFLELKKHSLSSNSG